MPVDQEISTGKCCVRDDIEFRRALCGCIRADIEFKSGPRRRRRLGRKSVCDPNIQDGGFHYRKCSQR